MPIAAVPPEIPAELPSRHRTSTVQRAQSFGNDCIGGQRSQQKRSFGEEGLLLQTSTALHGQLQTDLLATRRVGAVILAVVGESYFDMTSCVSFFCLNEIAELFESGVVTLT